MAWRGRTISLFGRSRPGAGTPGSASVTRALVDEVQQRCTLLEALEVLQEEGHGVLAPGGRVIGTMRGEQDVLQPPKGMVFRQRLGLEDVQRGAAQLSLLQGTHQGGLVEGAASADVDQHGMGLEGLQLRFPHQPLRAGGMWHGQQQVIRGGDHLLPAVEGKHLVHQRIFRALLGPAPAGQDAHVEALGPFRGRAPDVSVPQDAQGPSPQLHGLEGLPARLGLLPHQPAQVLGEEQHRGQDEIAQRAAVDPLGVGEGEGALDELLEEEVLHAREEGVHPAEVFGAGQQRAQELFFRRVEQEHLGLFDGVSQGLLGQPHGETDSRSEAPDRLQMARSGIRQDQQVLDFHGPPSISALAHALDAPAQEQVRGGPAVIPLQHERGGGHFSVAPQPALERLQPRLHLRGREAEPFHEGHLLPSALLQAQHRLRGALGGRGEGKVLGAYLGLSPGDGRTLGGEGREGVVEAPLVLGIPVALLRFICLRGSPRA
ncbi:hypothetical protein STIAU_4719 [Stigmatella aurantiaca DW4/3-1]|uniref:Uncharacterized protein n=1 Tax=Stigmatella aurantiaca (strain DW4/3-1) TaxID=378806 RepID=Q08SI0_STIAD|nr:hypothetical protein STIAU_4719 [Stigmatella aurantiaca DW4/3-1]